MRASSYMAINERAMKAHAEHRCFALTLAEMDNVVHNMLTQPDAANLWNRCLREHSTNGMTLWGVPFIVSDLAPTQSQAKDAPA